MDNNRGRGRGRGIVANDCMKELRKPHDVTGFDNTAVATQDIMERLRRVDLLSDQHVKECSPHKFGLYKIFSLKLYYYLT